MMTTTDTELVGFYMTMWKNKSSSLAFLISTEVSKICYLKAYESMIAESGLTPIENLPEETKKELVKECRDTGLSFTNNSLKDAARILHTIKFIDSKT